MEEYKKYEPIFGSWYLSRLLGKGSFGKVFEITREEYGTTYRSALKIITVPQDEDDVKSRMAAGTGIDSISQYYEGILKEIVNENEIMAQLKGNSNIVSYEDHQIIPHDDGIGYDILIRMELLTPLIDRMMQKKLDDKEVVKLGIDMCKALELCHKKNIIHRDIKPQNIFVSDSGDYKLGDFGIARTMEQTTGGMSKKGTYKYMAPEVFRGEHYDSTADIYSLGIVLFSLLNGNRGPFLPAPPTVITANDEEEARAKRLRGEPIPDLPAAGPILSMIIRRACEFYPQNRYATAEQMRADLESYLRNYGMDSPDNYNTGSYDVDETVALFPAGGAGGTGSYNPVNTGNYNPVNTGSYNPVNTGGYSPVGRKTGSYNPAGGGYQTNTGNYPVPDGPRVIQPVPAPKRKIWPFIVAGILTVTLIVTGVVIVMNNINDGGGTTSTEDGGGETPPVLPDKPDEASIPDDAEVFNGHHYKIVDESVLWTEARARCEAEGGHLVTVTSAEEQAFLQDYIERSGRKYHYWLGASDKDSAGEWKWLTGEDLPSGGNGSGYSNWKPDKPNNDRATDETGEHYLEMHANRVEKHPDQYMQWNDVPDNGTAIGSEEAPNYYDNQYYGYIIEWEQ